MEEIKRILVVDDDPTILLIVGETLRAEGYEVVTVSDPTQALEQVRATAFAVIVSDQKMPEMTGWNSWTTSRACNLMPRASC